MLLPVPPYPAAPKKSTRRSLSPWPFISTACGWETKKSTSLGKWSMQLEIIPARSPFVTACLRNSWLLLTPLTLTGWGIDGIILAILGLSVLAIGQTPFDLLAGCLVEKRPQQDSTAMRGER
ncbi:hypothetical protein ACLI1Q_001193 [Corynebacterium sp. LaCa191]|uniref:hypothetical protein n=1 Tax=unclassified Corynebacterium TaxID=2624378 RepID=UPI0032EE2381